MNDIDIAHSFKLKKIDEVLGEYGIDTNNIIRYGDYKAKIKIGDNLESMGKLILVTAINPTPLGEGKTTVSIGLADCFHKMGKKCILALREPSLGPVFGMKGGATGGGYSQIVPMEDINLHFTGDFAAIEACNNLLCAACDNHIYHGNKLKIKKILINRCLDVNDRALRRIFYDGGSSSFDITAASEIMALFCLADSYDDLRKRLGDIVVGIDEDDNFIYARDLGIVGSLVALLSDAFNPNVVQTLEGTLSFVHGGPFANIAHGCSSVVATRMALNYADYVITEAGFGADLGAEKFFDIKCRTASLNPHAVVVVVTIRALKYNGGVAKEDVSLKNLSVLEKGLDILGVHIDNMKKFCSNVVVCINKFEGDFDEEIDKVYEYCKVRGVSCSISTAYLDGGSGAEEVYEKIMELDDSGACQLLYDVNDNLVDKIKKVCMSIYRASDVIISDEVMAKIDGLNDFKLPICIAKTQYSLSDDSKKIGVVSDFSVTVRDVRLYNGAGFITVYLGNILTMPGLPKEPNYLNIDYVDGEIVGIK